MKKLLLVMTVLLLVGVANAETYDWAPSDANNVYAQWGEATNWDPVGIPDVNDTALFKAVLGECRVTGNQVARNIKIGRSGDAGVVRLMPGATLTTAGGHNYVGDNGVGHMVIERGAWWNLEERLVRLGYEVQAEGSSLEINGGTITTASLFVSGENGGGCDVYFNAGLIEAERGNSDAAAYNQIMVGVDNTFDICFGTIIVQRDITEDVAEEVAAGRMTAFGGEGTIVYDYNSEYTTVTATGDPLARYPTYDEMVPDGSLTLSWVNLDSDPCGSPVWVDVWYGPEGGSVTKVVSGATTTTYDTGGVALDDYEWQVDTYRYGDPAVVDYLPIGEDPNENPWDDRPSVDEGTAMYFEASSDVPPSVVIDTPPTATWKDNETFTLQATITDIDDETDVTITWSTVDEWDDPNVVFDPPTTTYVAEAETYPLISTTNVTVNAAIGNFGVIATVGDVTTPDADFDIVQHNCSQTACGASRNQINLGAENPTDLVGNCVHDLADLALIAEDWGYPDYELLAPIPLP